MLLLLVGRASAFSKKFSGKLPPWHDEIPDNQTMLSAGTWTIALNETGNEFDVTTLDTWRNEPSFYSGIPM